MGNQHWAQLIGDLHSENVDRAVHACEEISETANETNTSKLTKWFFCCDFFHPLS